jgi:hypothetical protein
MTLKSMMLAGSIFVLAGCKMNMEADLYSSDLRAVADGDQEITTPATLFLPVSNTDKCAEETAKIAAIMQGIVDPFQPKGCERHGMDSYLLADLQLPVVDSADAWEQADALFGVISQRSESVSDINVFVMMDVDSYRTLSERVRDEFHQSLDLKESTFTVVLNNDERADMTAIIEHAYVNGQPALNAKASAPRREQVTVRLSNVSVEYLGENGFVPAFILLDETQQ